MRSLVITSVLQTHWEMRGRRELHHLYMYLYMCTSMNECVVEHWSRETVMWVRILPGAAHFFFEREKSEPSQVVLLCCLALFIVSPLFLIMYKCTSTRTCRGRIISLCVSQKEKRWPCT